MLAKVVRVSALVALAVYVLPLRADEIVFPDFSDTSPLTINGIAHTLTTGDGVVMRLATANTFVGGSTFSTVPLDATEFSTTFRFRISDRGGLANGADGIVFVVQSESAGVGGLGGGIGFQNIQNSVGVEFDTYQNSEFNDPSSNHLGIVTLGNVDHGAGAPHTLNVSPDFDDGNIWYAWIDYDGTTLEVRTNQTGVRPVDAMLSQVLDIPAILGQGTGFVGFTSATGSGVGNHDILSWSYTNPVPEPSTLALASLGLLGLLARRFRRPR